MSFWKSLRPSGLSGNRAYDLGRLVDYRLLDQESIKRAPLQVICDIDKTYLETEFESLTRLLAIAFEAATDKITVTGASDVLKAARWGDVNAAPRAGATGDDQAGDPQALHFVSSSPPQLRAVLEEKLRLDGIDWTSDTFKNQAYNLRKRRMDQLRQHVGYKSLAILRVMEQAPRGAEFILIGDNAESDAYIYTGVDLLTAGIFDADSYLQYLTTAGVDEELGRTIQTMIPETPPVRVKAILIRDVPAYELQRQAPLTDRLDEFTNFFQAALILVGRGVIEADRLWYLTRCFHNQHGLAQSSLRQDLETFAEGPGIAAEVRNEALRVAGKLGVVNRTRDETELNWGRPTLRGETVPLPPADEALVHARQWWRSMRGELDEGTEQT